MLWRRRRRRRKRRLLGSPHGRTVEKERSTPGGGSRPEEWVHRPVLRSDRRRSDREAEGRPPMSLSHSIPPTIHIRRSRLTGLIAVVAALAAAVTWLVLTLAFDNGTTSSTASAPASSVAQIARRVPSMPLTGAQG